MFYVFGINGPMYPPSSDRLSRIAGVGEAPRLGGLRADASGVQGQAAQPQPSIVRQPGSPPRGQGAVSAYVGTEQGPKPARQPMHLVRDVMTRGVVTLTPEQPAYQAWKQLAQHRIGQAPVLDGGGRVVGLLVRADLAPRELRPEPSAVREAMQQAQRPVGALMRSPVHAVAETADVRRVAQVLLENALPGLPVTDAHGHLSGFVSRSDLLRAVASDPPLDVWS